MMTRKDFIEIAAILRYRLVISNTEMNGNAAYEIITIAGELADYFQMDNPNFDRDRFMNAVNPNPDK